MRNEDWLTSSRSCKQYDCIGIGYLREFVMNFQRAAALVVALYVSIPANFCGEARLQKGVNVPAYFVFGDSFADVGTNNFLPHAAAQANFPPYGETFFHKATGRFTNGRNIVDFFALTVGLPTAPPFLQPNSSFIAGVNFASARSGLLNNTIIDNKELVSSTGSPPEVRLKEQVEQYKTVRILLQNQLSTFGAEKLISKSVFLILSGSDELLEYLSNFEIQKRINATQFISKAIEDYQTTLTDLYKSGARKALLVGLFPLGCSPSARVTNSKNPGECSAEGNELAMRFNDGVRQLVDELYVVFPDYNIIFAESYNLIQGMINDKKSYGLDSISSACCGAGFLNAQVRCGLPMPSGMIDVDRALCQHPSKFLFWDVDHPTERVMGLLFKSFWTGNSSISYPTNVKALASL